MITPFRLLSAVLLASTTACFVSVTDSDGKLTLDTANNTPVVGQSSDGLGYALRARDYTSSEQYGPVVKTKTVAVATAVSAYSYGSAVIDILDATSAVVLHQGVTNNLAQASAVIRGVPPFKVNLSFQHFSGAITLAVGPADSTRVP